MSDFKTGIKKLFKAEILSLVASVLFVLFAALGVTSIGVALAGGTSSSTGALIIVAVVFLIAWIVITIVGFVMQIKGLVLAGKYNVNFKYALYWVIGTIIATIAGRAFAASNEVVSQIITLLGQLLSLMFMFFVIKGSTEVLNIEEITASGKRINTLISISLILSVLAKGYSAKAAATAATVFGGVSSILTLVYYISFLCFLSKVAKNAE